MAISATLIILLVIAGALAWLFFGITDQESKHRESIGLNSDWVISPPARMNTGNVAPISYEVVTDRGPPTNAQVTIEISNPQGGVTFAGGTLKEILSTDPAGLVSTILVGVDDQRDTITVTVKIKDWGDSIRNFFIPNLEIKDPDVVTIN